MQIIRTSGEEVLESEGIHLSVVIPVFNEEQVVLEMLRALDSLFLPLERTRIEILIVDDGSNRWPRGCQRHMDCLDGCRFSGSARGIAQNV